MSEPTDSSPGHDGCAGCSEYHRLTRRGFVGMAGGALAALAAPAWLPRVVYADSHSSGRDVIVSIFLRGGADGLTLCVPHGDDGYYSLRPNLAIARPDASGGGRAIDLDGFFGLPPALGSLEDAYREGDLLVVHACGLPDSSRSHFEAMRYVETGQGGGGGGPETGWLGRHLAATAPAAPDAVLRAVGIGVGLQRTLAGAPDALPIAELGEFGLGGPRATRRERRLALEAIYAEAGEPLAASAANTFRTIDLLRGIGFESYRPSGGARYPDDEFGQALASTAALVKADAGVEAVAIDLGGWDTHDFQGPVEGQMAALMGSFGAGVAAFHQDLNAAGRTDYVLTALSEFGRNARENGSQGTDHGTAGAMLVLGGAVDGGRVLSEWPGLAPGQLFDDQDLAVAIDYRDVLSEIVGQRLQGPSPEVLFPDPRYRPTTWGVVEGA